MEIKLFNPLVDIDITQKFGENKVNFYKELGLKGHNGVDYRATINTPVYACHYGEVLFAGVDGDGGVSITLVNDKNGDSFKTIYYHLNHVEVKSGDVVRAGQLIGRSGNTGKYTTGPHLHLGLKLCRDTVTLNYDNGYNGAIDPLPYILKSRANDFYGRQRNWLAEYYLRFAPENVKNRWTEGGRYIHQILRRIGFSSPFMSGDSINAIIYGGWDLEAVLDENMAMYIKMYKKDEFNK